MPRISFFYGIAIYMYYRDHAPPHFHAIYADHEAVVDIVSGEVIAGTLPARARSLVSEWATMHRDDLRRNWEFARAAQPLDPVSPLD